ncbi:MAG: multicopper oxidase domain-containing protein [Candidatus Paceibacterota bacterium]
MGRFGDTILINDREDYSFTVKQGEISRIFVTNVANTRTFDIAFENADMKLVGGDNGRIQQEVMIDDFVIAPSERYVIELLYADAGTYPITHRGETVGQVALSQVVQINVWYSTHFAQNASDYTELRSQMDTFLAKAPDKRLRLDIEMKGMAGMQMMNQMQNSGDGETVNLMGMEMSREGAIEHCQMMPQMAGCEPFLNADSEEEVEHSEDGIEWEDDMAMMNQMSTDESIEWVIEDQDTGKQNGDIDWTFKQNDLVKVRVYNDENGMHPMQHPLHFHGQRFIVLAVDGEANENLQWKDTVLIQRGQTYDLLIDMSNTGTWMAHCHIAEHLHSGMMFQFKVE